MYTAHSTEGNDIRCLRGPLHQQLTKATVFPGLWTDFLSIGQRYLRSRLLWNAGEEDCSLSPMLSIVGRRVTNSLSASWFHGHLPEYLGSSSSGVSTPGQLKWGPNCRKNLFYSSTLFFLTSSSSCRLDGRLSRTCRHVLRVGHG